MAVHDTAQGCILQSTSILSVFRVHRVGDHGLWLAIGARHGVVTWLQINEASRSRVAGEMDDMKIALLVDQYFNPTGVGVYTRELIKNLLVQNHSDHFLLVYPGRKGAEQLAAVIDSSNASVVAIPDRRLLYPVWHFANRPAIESWTGRVDLVHYVSGAVRLPSRAPQVTGVTDLASERTPRFYPLRRRWFKNRLLRQLRASHGHALTISEFSKRDLVDLAGICPTRISVTHLGVDRSRFFKADRDRVDAMLTKYKMPKQYWLSIGALSPRKNIALLLNAFSQAADVQPSIDLVLAGPTTGWNYSDVLDSWRHSRHKQRIRFIGYVDREDLPALYSGAVALAYPSLHEGFGLPLVEAMACGAPIVCARGSSLEEVGRDAPIYCSPTDPAEFAQALLRTTDSDAAESMRQRGFERARRFTWDETAKETLQVYKRVAKTVSS